MTSWNKRRGLLNCHKKPVICERQTVIDIHTKTTWSVKLESVNQILGFVMHDK